VTKAISKRATTTAPAKAAQGPQQPVDMSEAALQMRPADRDHFHEAVDWYNGQPLPISVKLENTDGKKWVSRFEGNTEDEIVGRLRTHAAFGSMSQPFIDIVMGELMTIWASNGGISDKIYNAAVAVLEAAAPRNELEAMLVVQMIASNEAALRATSMVGKCGMPEQALGFGNLSNKYMRTFVAQSEALAKLRRGGEQIVKYVHVHEGGQAVVAGTINQTGGRLNAGSAEQPHEQAADASVPTLPGENSSGNGVSVSRDAEREMPDSRWQESRGTEGE
jgi:hypothetical protein